MLIALRFLITGYVALLATLTAGIIIIGVVRKRRSARALAETRSWLLRLKTAEEILGSPVSPPEVKEEFQEHMRDVLARLSFSPFPAELCARAAIYDRELLAGIKTAARLKRENDRRERANYEGESKRRLNEI